MVALANHDLRTMRINLSAGDPVDDHTAAGVTPITVELVGG